MTGNSPETLEVSRPNKTGLPDRLKTGIENLSSYSMDDVRVHYNPDKPAQSQAHAYTQGTEIHVAPGQEKHLPHEAWHVVQQKQGRVKPTLQMKRVQINDDKGLEREANVMGGKVLRGVRERENSRRDDIQVKVAKKEDREITDTIQLMSDQEDEEITNWIRLYADDYLSDVNPGRIDDAPLSKAVRLRWFGLRIRGNNYTVGLNIHYGGNQIGAVWVKNQASNETKEFHPYQQPQHGFGQPLINRLRLYVQNMQPNLLAKI